MCVGFKAIRFRAASNHHYSGDVRELKFDLVKQL